MGLPNDMSPSALGRRYVSIVALLSLDLTVEFHAEIGLAPLAATPLLASCRALIRSDRSRFFTLDAAHLLALPRRVAELATHRLGNESAHYLAWWVIHVYSAEPRDHLDLEAWTLLFRSARSSPESWRQLELPSALSAEVLARFNHSTNLDAWEQFVNELDRKRLSNWDLHLYVLLGWNDDLPGTPNGPQSMLYPIHRAWRNLEFWRWLQPRLTEQELERLHRASENLLLADPSLRFLETLPNPRQLRLEAR